MAYHPHRKTKNEKHQLLGLLVSFVVILGPVMTLPQIYLIFSTQNADGVSAVTFASYVFGALVWLMYGIVHNEKPIIINSGIGAILSSIVVLGALLY